jgi:hypothetical protein
MESALRLHRQPAGTLLAMDRYLHKRTGGRIGSLSRLVRVGAVKAIMGDGEAITQDLLDGIPAYDAASPR